MGSIGPTELILIALVALLIFGAGRISDIGKGLGEGIRNFKKGISDDTDEKSEKSAKTLPDTASKESDEKKTS